MVPANALQTCANVVVLGVCPEAHAAPLPALQRTPSSIGMSSERRPVEALRSTSCTVPPLYWRSKSEFAT
jgi:hypothetical protein